MGIVPKMIQKSQKPYIGLIKKLGIFGLILDGHLGIYNLQMAWKLWIGEIIWWVILKKILKISTTLLRPIKKFKNFWANIR